MLNSNPDVAQPEWLEKAVPEAISTLELLRKGHVPQVLTGRFIVTTCMRLLRCVYGSDLETVAALREKVMNDVAFWQKVDAMTKQEQRAYFKRLEESALRGRELGTKKEEGED